MRWKIIVLLFLLLVIPISGESFSPPFVVGQAHIDVAAVRFDRTEIVMNVGETVRLTATVAPSNATNKRVNWRVSDAGIVDLQFSLTNNTIAVNQIRAVAPGAVTVTATSEDGNRSVSCVVTVREPVRSISLDRREASLAPNDELILTVSFTPREATNQNVTWHSTSPDVASVTPVNPATTTARSPQARIVGHKEGEARIVVRSNENNSITAYCTVTVSRSADPAGSAGGEQQPGQVEPVPTDPALGAPGTDGARIAKPVYPYVIAAGVVALLAVAALALFYKSNQALALSPALITAVSGQFSGQKIPFIKNRLVIGRDPEANLVYSPANQKISRIHCTVNYDPPSKSYIIIDSSTNGTFFANGEKLESGKPYVLKPGDRFYLADQEELFEL